MQTEDAAVVLADFVSSLDNLPAEVHHILQEIGHKEARVIDLKNRAQSRDAAIQKHARPSHQGGAGLLTVNPKEEGSVVKIRADLEKAEAISREKVALTERGVALLSRHLTRLNSQLELLGTAIPPIPGLPNFAPIVANGPPASMNYANSSGYQGTPSQFSSYGSYASTNPYGYIQKRASSQSLSGLASGAQTPTSAAYGSPATGGRPTQQQPHHHQQQQQQQQQAAAAAAAAAHKHRLSQVYPSPSNLTPDQQRQLAAQQARLAQQQMLQQQAILQQQQQLGHAPYGGHHHGGASSAAAANKKRKYEEDEGADEAGDGDDNTPYCFCHRPSFGEMIGCDSEDCEIEWFHLSCVGLKTTPSGSWYCANCEPKIQAQRAAAQGRRGRKG